MTEPSAKILRFTPPTPARSAATVRGTRWVVMRSLLGLALLSGFVVGGVLLMNASIDRSAPGQTDSEE